jgi:hypothetical protein
MFDFLRIISFFPQYDFVQLKTEAFVILFKIVMTHK